MIENVALAMMGFCCSVIAGCLLGEGISVDGFKHEPTRNNMIAACYLGAIAYAIFAALFWWEVLRIKWP